jgi:hypothetical protein
MSMSSNDITILLDGVYSELGIRADRRVLLHEYNADRRLLYGQ